MNEGFGAITILAPKCQKCPKVKSCDHKQMAHGKVDPFMNMGVPKELLTGEKMLAKGTDIGNQLAQNIGIVFPYRIDNYCKIVCGMKHQGRYSDGSDPIFVDTELVEILEKIRTHFNKPVTITSAFRTASWNAKQKNAAKYSQHLYGKAADIQVQGISVEQVYAYADKLLAGRGGVGIYPPGLGRANGWVHVDVRKEKSRWRG